MRLHPATQILIWCVLLTMMPFLSPDHLLIAGALILTLAFIVSRRKLVQLLLRTRWIMLSLILIYGYTTTGTAVVEMLGAWGPSVEGLTDGGLQLMRLIAALAGLAILLGRLHRPALMSGLYCLFAPLTYFGVSRERLAVRLALTLHYAEAGMLRGGSWQDSLRSLTADNGEPDIENRTVALMVHRVSLADTVLLVAMVILLWQVVR
ncbi:MAG: hypothetical protein WCK93_04595 [Nitrosomonadales bacterium]